MKIYGITGANGYVGSVITHFIKSKGEEIIEIGRTPSSPKVKFIHYQLGEPIQQEELSNIDVLIHCAYDMKLRKQKDIERINVQGSISLLRAVHQAKIKKTILISSLAAYEGAHSLYGQGKLTIENEAKKIGASIIRPSLVFGKSAKGIVGKLTKIAQKIPVVPMVGFGNQIFYLVHKEDLAAIVYELANEKQKRTQPIYAASKEAFTFKQLITTLANGKKKIFVPIPYSLLYTALKFTEIIGLKIGLKSDSLIGLQYRNPRINFDQNIKTTFREFNKKTMNE